MTRRPYVAVPALALALAGATPALAAAQARRGVHRLEPTPQTVAWGYYDA